MKRILLSFTLICLSLAAMCQRSGYNPYATQQPTEWSGTGWALNNGYVVTNHHVVEGAQSIQVLLTDERSFQAYLVGTDAVSDLAVLYIEADSLVAAEFGDASQLQVGDAVAAIGIGGELGNALAYDLHIASLAECPHIGVGMASVES